MSSSQVDNNVFGGNGPQTLYAGPRSFKDLLAEAEGISAAAAAAKKGGATKKKQKSKKTKKSKKSKKTTTKKTTTPPPVVPDEDTTPSPTPAPVPSTPTDPTPTDQPTSSQLFPTSITTSFPTISSPPTAISCSVGNNNFVGVLGSEVPVEAVGIDYNYAVLTSFAVTSDDVRDDIAPDVKTATANYLASELISGCNGVLRRHRSLVMLGDDDDGDARRRKLRATGIYTAGAEAVINGPCESINPSTACWSVTDTLIIISDATNNVELREDTSQASRLIQQGMDNGYLSYTNFLIRGLEYRTSPSPNGNNRFDGNQILDGVANSSSNNTLAIALGASAGAILFIMCACLMRFYQKERRQISQEEVSQDSRMEGKHHYNHQQHYNMDEEEEHERMVYNHRHSNNQKPTRKMTRITHHNDEDGASATDVGSGTDDDDEEDNPARKWM